MNSKVCCKAEINSPKVFLLSYGTLKTIGNHRRGIIGASNCEKRHRLFQTSELDLLPHVTTDYIFTSFAKRFTTIFSNLHMSHSNDWKKHCKFHTKYFYSGVKV